MTGDNPTRSLRVLVVAILCSIGWVPSLWADPIVVTSGKFELSFREVTFYDFSGADGFHLNAAIFEDATPVSPERTCGFGCALGSVLDMSTVVGGESAATPFALGRLFQANISGTEFSFPAFESRPRLVGTFRFDAPPVVLPTELPRSLVTAPFVFNGDVTGFASDDPDRRAPLFHVSLVGQGTTTMDFEDGIDRGKLIGPVVRYNFAAAPAATPEPATLALFGTGLLGLAARARQRRRR